MSEGVRRLYAPFVLSLSAAVALSAPAQILNGVERHLHEAARFIPPLKSVQGATFLFPLLALGLAAWWTLRMRTRVRELSIGKRVVYLVGVTVFVAAVTAAAVMANVLTQPNWLFGPPPPYARVPSPDGRRVAYATLDCFLFCDVQVHVQERGALLMRRVQRVDGVSHEEPFPTLEWLPDSSDVQLQGLRHQTPVFDWNPH